MGFSNYEMKILFILALCLFCKTGGQQPSGLCSEDKPFRLNDRTCENLNSICFKQGDTQCDQLLNACKQCPPSNITLKILRDIWNMSKFQSKLSKEIMEEKIPNMMDKLNSTQQFITKKLDASSLATNVASSYTIPILLVIIIIILIIHFVEIRFKLITKLFQKLAHKGSRSYWLIQSRKENHLKELNKNTTKELTDLKKTVENLSQKLSDHIQYLQNQPLATHYAIIKFYKEGIEHKCMELYVNNNENIVEVKQRLCTSLADADHDDYKRIKLKYNGKILDDNDYLLKYIDSSTNSVNYIIDRNIDTSEIVVVDLEGKMRIPKIIQIYQNENIGNFVTAIGNLIHNKDCCVYKEFTKDSRLTLQELIKDTNKTVKDFYLKDGDFLHVVTIESGELILRSIFNEIDLFTVKYDNIDLISTFSQNRNNDMTNFIFFYRNEIMDENKFIFQFDINNASKVNFCEFKKFDGSTDNRSLYSDNKCEIYWATHKGNEKVLMKKYEEFYIKSENLKNKDWVLNELKTFLITKSHRRFIQLNGVYFDDNACFYVSMENMPGGTLGYYLKNNKEFDSTQISKWAAQILEGLNFLHQHKIIHRDLNPLSILVGDNNYLKLSNFNLSKYDTNGGPCSILGKDVQLCYIKLRYMAPELLDSREYGFQCDVWSFGAVLVRIVTDKKPYPRSSKIEAQNKIIKSGKIEYELPDRFDIRIKSIVDSCFHKDPYSRCKIKDLVENEIIKNSL